VTALSLLAHDARLHRADLLDDDGERDALAAEVEAARRADPARLTTEARVLLVNDLWGVYQRATEGRAEQIDTAPLAAAVAGLIARLAPTPAELARVAPPPIATALPGSGWTERATELDELSHERAFGLRRVFHVFTRDDDRERALVQTVVALDAEGGAHDSGIVAGVEHIAPRGDHVVVEVLERRPGSANLEPVTSIEAIPLGGANRSLIDFDSAVVVSPELCARCHAGDGLRGGPGATLNALPTTGDPRPRQRALLARAGADAAILFGRP
jgi:hypothetical protein